MKFKINRIILIAFTLRSSVVGLGAKFERPIGLNVMPVTYGGEDGNTIHESSRETPSGIDAFRGVVAATDLAYDLSISKQTIEIVLYFVGIYG